MSLKTRFVIFVIAIIQLPLRVLMLVFPVGFYQISHGEDGKRSTKFEVEILLPKRVIDATKISLQNGRESHASKQEVLRQFNSEVQRRKAMNERYENFVPLELHQFGQLKIAELGNSGFRNRIQYLVLSYMT